MANATRMIVSASYHTDILAFYPDWFRRRLAAGFCRVANPYGGRDSVVSLVPADVSGFVFWTRNPVPFLPALEEVAGLGIPFVLQTTVTGYPRALDAATPDAATAVAAMRAVADRHGSKVCVWRYDPVVIGAKTTPARHRERFAGLAKALKGTTDEVVVSFVQPYRKTVRNLERAVGGSGDGWRDPPADEKRALLGELAGLAAEQGIRLAVCGQPDLAGPEWKVARCIDAERLSAIAGRAVAVRGKAHRPTCECAPSRDIGAYDTCPHGCAYCYAVTSRERAKRALAGHDPDAERL